MEVTEFSPKIRQARHLPVRVISLERYRELWTRIPPSKSPYAPGSPLQYGQLMVAAHDEVMKFAVILRKFA